MITVDGEPVTTGPGDGGDREEEAVPPLLQELKLYRELAAFGLPHELSLFTAGDAAEFDGHALLVLIPPDGIGNDGGKHVPVDPSAPERWYFGGGQP